jgi:hypothetical protein
MRQRLAKVQEQPETIREPETPSTKELPAAMPSAEELRAMISEAAYYRAEKRGFAPGLEADDWLQAEAEILTQTRAGETRI